MISVPVAATAMSFNSLASREFKTGLSITTLLVTAIEWPAKRETVSARLVT
jgi:hypothetical protein